MKALAVLAVVVGLFTVTATAGLATPERRMARFINRERVEQGLKRLDWRPRMHRYAERHTKRMIEAGYLFHSDLSFPKPRRWSKAGENVGVGNSVLTLHDAFMDSPGHRANVMEPVYRYIGVGVKRNDGAMWVTVEFVG